jgi:hypothetical protein
MLPTRVAAIAAVVLLALSACSPNSDEPSSAPSPAPAPSDTVPAGYVAEIQKVAPDVPEKRAVSAAENTCQQAEAGEDESILLKNLAARLEVSAAVAAKALPIVRKHYCPEK